MVILAVLVVFVATFTLAAVAVIIASVWLQPETAPTVPGAVPGEAALFKTEELSSISLWDHFLAHFDYVDAMKRNIAQADLGWSVGRLTSMMLLAGAIGFALASSFESLPLVVLIALGLASSSLPYLYVLRRRARRLAQFDEQFPDALEFLARALRAGHPFPVAMEMLSIEEAAPLSTEIRITVDERRLGRQWSEALRNLSNRIPLLSVRLFVAAVQLQSRTGGKLNEVLGQLAETNREAASLKGEVRALAAHGRMTGAVLTLLPVGIVVMMMIVNPDYLLVLTQHPWGPRMIAAAVVSLVLAHLVIRKIVDIRP